MLTLGRSEERQGSRNAKRGASERLRVIWSPSLELTELVIRRVVPPGSGVYVLWGGAGAGQAAAPRYVGSAADLQRRLLRHLSGAYCTQALGALEDGGLRFHFAQLDPPEARRGVVEFMFHCLRPSANRRSPGGAALAVNLPSGVRARA